MLSKPFITAGISIFVLTLTACVYDCTYSYFVVNKSETTIKLIVEGYGNDGTVSQQFMIPAGAEQVVFADEGTNGGVGNRPNEIFTVFAVLKYDTIPTRTNFKLNEKWVYTETSSKRSSLAAKYTAEVNDGDF